MENLKYRLREEDLEQELENYLLLLNPFCAFINKCQSPSPNVAHSTEYWLSLPNQMLNQQYDAIIRARIFEAVWDVGYAANYTGLQRKMS